MHFSHDKYGNYGINISSSLCGDIKIDRIAVRFGGFFFVRVFMMRATINKTHIPYFGVNRVLWTFIAHAHGCQLCTQFHALLTGCRCTWIGLRKFTCKLYLQICMWNVQNSAILIDIEHERSRTHMQLRFHSYWVLFWNSIYMRVYDIAVTQHLH